MKFTRLKQKNKNIGAALMQAALMASSFSASAANAAYYSGRRIGYSAGKNKSYLADAGLNAVSRDLFAYRKIAINQAKENSVSDVTLKKSSGISELLVVDHNIKDYRQFSGLLKPGVELVEIPQGTDGFAFLINTLSSYQNLKAVHLFSHASAGELLLGNTLVNSAVLKSHPEFSAVLNQSVKQGGDFLLYGCELGKGEKGGEFLEIIRNNNHIDVAASDNLSGNANLNADWDLEIRKGDIEARPLANSIAMKDFTEVLQVTTTIDFNPSSYVYGSGPYGSNGYSAASDVQFNVGSYVLTVDGQNGYTAAFSADKVYNQGGATYTETKTSFSFSGGASFKPKSITLFNLCSERTQDVTITTNNGGSVTVNNIASQTDGGANVVVDISSLPVATQIIVTGNIDGNNVNPPFGSGAGKMYLMFDELKVDDLGTASSNSAPTDVSLSAISINENVAANSTVGTLSTTDADAGNTFTYTLVSGTGSTDNAAFNISGSNLRITNSPDYETKNSYNIRIRTTDQGSLSFEKQFTITVNNVNEAPTATNLTQSKSFTEDAGSVALDDIVVSDADAGETITATLTLSNVSAGTLSTGTFGSATSTFDAGTGVWTVTGSRPDVNAALAAVAFAPAANFNQNFTITTRIRDAANTGPADGTISFTGSPVNDAPLLSGGPYTFSGIAAGATSSAVSVSTLLAGLTYSDLDAGAQSGIAITALSGGGTWQYSTDGTNFYSLGTISGSSALLLSNTSQLRYNNPSATETASLTFRAWDQTSGTATSGTTKSTADVTTNGGSSAFSSGTAEAQISVTAQPAITSSTYDASTGVLAVTGTDFTANGSGADVDVSKLTLTGEGGNTYTLTSTGVEISSATAFSVTLNSTDRAAINQIINKNGTSSTGGTTYNLAAAANWMTVISGAADVTGNGITASNVAVPTITSATYDASTGALNVTGTDFLKLNGSNNDIVTNKFTLTGEGGSTYTLTDSANPEISSGTSFTIMLSATDRAAINQLVNKNGTSSTGGTTYNLAAAEDWAAGADAAVVVADAAGNGITVSNVAIPAITSATYNASTGALVVTGTGFLALNGSNNDIIANKFTLTGEGGSTYTLTDSANPEISSGTSFTITFSATDKTAINQVINKNGTASTGGTTYNLAAAEDWAAGANAAVTLADVTGNGITASNVAMPAITSTTYDASTGTLVVIGTGFLKLSGASNDIVANKFTITGEGGSTYTLTNTANVEITSGTAFSLTLSATDKTAINQIINRNGTASTGGTTYNLAAAEDWAAGADAAVAVADVTGNGITTSNVAIPAITSATYDASTGALVVTGTGFLKLSGAANDIVANKFTLTGEGGTTYTLTNTTNVETTSGTAFSLVLSTDDKTAINQLVNKNGTASTDGTTYNLAAAEDWAAGADAAVGVADVTGNGVTVSGLDETAPTITNVSVPANGTYKSGDNLGFTLNFSENVTVTGTPSVALVIGSTTVAATYSSGSGSNALVFGYTIAAGDIDANGITVGALSLNSGSIKDAAGNAAVLTLNSVGNTSHVLVDAIAPTISSVSSSTSNGTYKTGDAISIQVNFNENVTVTGTPQLTLETGVTDRTINYVSGSGSTALTFIYTVQAGDASSDLDYTGTAALALNSGSIKDAAGNNATLTLASPGGANSLGSNKALVIDGIAPSLAITSNVSTLKKGETASITFTFSEDPGATFTWDGSSGDITISGGTLSAIAGSGLTRTATFTPTDNVNAGTASITVSAGSYADAAGNNGLAGMTPALTFDTQAPTTTIASLALSNDSGVSATDFITNSASQTISGILSANLLAGETMEISVDGGNTYNAATATVGSNTYSISATLTGSNTIKVRVVDGSGNPGTVYSQAYVLDTTAPAAPSTPDLASGSDSGNSSTDNLTNSSTVVFNGTAEAGATVRLFDTDGSTELGNALATGGSWSITTATTIAEGSHTVTARAIDKAGNISSPSSSLTVEIDRTAPAANSIAVADNALAAGETSTVTITFSEAVTGFDLGDLSAENGTLSNLSTSDQVVYTATLTPANNLTDASNVISLINSGVSDIAGNAGTGTATSNNYGIDTKRPTVAITLDNASLKINETAIVTFTFSEAVSGFTLADVTVQTGPLASLASADGGITWTATFTPSANIESASNTISVDLTGVLDVAGNSGTGTGTSANYTVDTKAPAAPADLAVTAGNQQNTLSWTANAETDLASYKVYGGTTSSPTGLLQTVNKPATSYTHTGLTNGITYFYRITAVDAAGNESAYSTEKSAKPQAPQSITFAGLSNTTYGDADFAPGATASSGLTVSYTSSNTAVATIVSGKIHVVGAGTATITASQDGDDAYLAASPVDQTLTVNQKAITVTSDAKNKTYGDADPALTYQITSGSLIGTDAFSGSLSRDAGENVGTYAIKQGSLALNNNYNLTYSGANLTIGQKAIAVTGDAKSKTYGDADPAFTYQITSGSLIGTDAFSGSLSRDAGENVGTYAIKQGSLALSNNYNLTYTGANLTIGQKAIAVAADAKSKTYGDADPALTYQITSGALVGTDVFSGSLARAAGEHVGTYAINQGSLTLNNNYNLTYTGADLTIGQKAIAVAADAKSKTYGDADPAFTYQITSGTLVGSDAFSGGLSRTAGENVGTYAIKQGSLALSNNYNLTYSGANLTIGQKAIAVAADAKSKTYGDADPSFTYQITSGALVGTDAFSGSLSRDAGENVGTYAINQGSLALSNNYNLTYSGANLTIGQKAIAVAADAKSKTYGDADPAFTYQITSGALVGTDAFNGSLSRDAGESAGTYAIKQGSLALSNNYNLTYTGANLTIGKKNLTITADNKEKFEGEANPVLTASYSGFIGGENNSVLSTQPVLNTTALAASPQGTYPITVSGAAAQNYNISYQSGTLRVKPGAPTSISLAASTLYENRPAGTLAGTLSSSSLSPTATFTYTLVNGTGSTENSNFIISGNQLLTAAPLDFESKQSYQVRVRSTTQYNLSLEQTFTITLNDVNEAPTLDAIANQTICYTTGRQEIVLSGITAGPDAGQSVSLTASNSNSSLLSDLSISNNNELRYRVAEGQSGTATITVRVQDDGGTLNGGTDTYSRSFILTIHALPAAQISSDKGQQLSKGETAVLTATGGSSYSWSNAAGIISGQNSATLTIRPLETTTYTVLVTNASGCESVASYTITVNDDFRVLEAENFFTPNGDGINDVWIVKNIDAYPAHTLMIVDRGGREVYKTKGYQNDWNGTVNGSDLQNGTYYYVFKFDDATLAPMKGFITIVR